MMGLSTRQKIFLLLRFGGRRVATAEEVAAVLGISPEEACRIEAAALRRLRLNAVRPTLEDRGGWDEV